MKEVVLELTHGTNQAGPGTFEISSPILLFHLVSSEPLCLGLFVPGVLYGAYCVAIQEY
jgi:hypothetical protein